MENKPKHILNDATTAVDEFLEGLLLQYPNQLIKLRNHHVIFPTDRFMDKVQLISGGGSGHEPSHAGWCGAGMLSAAVCGGVFASPPVHTILAAIRASSTPQGTLLIVKNYTGDRLNFGIAAERANQEGKDVQMVVVADDVALPRTKGITGARGVAGTILVHKIAGAAAAAGKSLQEVAAIARTVCSNMGTLGVTLEAVTVPGAEQINNRLDGNTIEVGLGIHGEAGIKQSHLMSANEIAVEMVTKIHSYGRNVKTYGPNKTEENIIPMFDKEDEVVVLVNNLGGTSNFEMSILARACVKLLEGPNFGVKATRVMVGSYMTSFNMHGASLTILNVTGIPELVRYLDAETTAPAWRLVDAWKVGASGTRRSAVELDEVILAHEQMEVTMPPLSLSNFAEIARIMVTRAATELANAEPLLTKYDTIVGDGDCGITMKRGAEEVKRRLYSGELRLDHPVLLFSSLADAVSTSMGGTSGILLELFFRKMGSFLIRVKSVGANELRMALREGVDAISLYGGAQAGSRTMLDALIPAAKELIETGSLRSSAMKAREGANSTASMVTASAGRSNYVSTDTLKGTPDPGAAAVALVFESLLTNE